MLLVAETKAVLIASFTLAFREAKPAVTTLGVSSKPSTKIYRRLLEYLGRDLFPQESAVTSVVAVPSGSITNTRPALSLVFQRLKALIKSKPDQGTHTDGSTFPAASASVTGCRL